MYRPPPAAVKRRWQWCAAMYGPSAPATRAAFGRFVASIGGQVGALAAESARVAHQRWSQPGYHNRAARKAIQAHILRQVKTAAVSLPIPAAVTP